MSVDERHNGPFPSMPAVSHDEYASASVRRRLLRERAERRAGYRSRWWFPLVLLLAMLSGFWGLLKADQLVADQLIWPTQGGQFVEVGPVPQDPDVTGGRMMIVAGGLNRKSGTGPAAALMPTLTVGHTRVFSLVYGSGITDRDLLDKYDALMDRLRPREVSFFGSSMGGDVVLNLAAHAQETRDEYRQELLAASVAANRAGATGIDPSLGSLAVGAAAPPGGVADTAPIADPPLLQPNTVTGSQAAGIASLLVLPDAQASAGAGAGAVALAGNRSGAAAAAPGAAVLPDPNGNPTESGEAAAARAADPLPPTPARLGVIYLDCSPLGPQDVRDESRTQADALTALTETLDTDGGAGVRITAEVLAQQQQWSYGRMPFVDVRWQELAFKIRQVWRDKIGSPGISTQLVKDQYGVIRRMDIEELAAVLGPGTRLVFFHPVNPDGDQTVRVDRVQSTLSKLAEEDGLNLRFVGIPGGHHASAETDADLYRAAITAINGGAI